MDNPNLTREETDKITCSLLAHRLGGPRQRLNRLVASVTPFPDMRTGDVLTEVTAGILASLRLFLVVWLIVAGMRRPIGHSNELPTPVALRPERPFVLKVAFRHAFNGKKGLL